MLKIFHQTEQTNFRSKVVGSPDIPEVLRLINTLIAEFMSFGPCLEVENGRRRIKRTLNKNETDMDGRLTDKNGRLTDMIGLKKVIR